MKKYFYFLIFISLGACNVFAPSFGAKEKLTLLHDYKNSNPNKNTKISSLPEFAEFNIDEHPAVQAAKLRWHAAKEEIIQADTLPEPELSYRFMAMDSSGELAGHTFSISQMFPWFGVLSLSSDIADARARAAFEEYMGVKLSTIAAIKEAWSEYVYVHGADKILQEHDELLKNLNGVIKALYQTGEATQSDLLRNQMEIERIKKERQDVLALKQAVGLKLNAALGQSANSPLPTPVKLSAEPLQIDAKEFTQKLLNLNPSLLSLKHNLEARKTAVALAKKKFYPQLMLGLDYGLGSERRMARMDGEDRDSIGAMVGLRIPLWFSSYRAAMRQAMAEQEAAKKDLINSENLLEAELALLFFQFNEAQRRIHLFGDSLKVRSEQVLETTHGAYTAKEATFTDLLAAQRELLEIALAHERALADRFQHLAAIEATVGAAFYTVAVSESEEENK